MPVKTLPLGAISSKGGIFGEGDASQVRNLMFSGDRLTVGFNPHSNNNDFVKTNLGADIVLVLGGHSHPAEVAGQDTFMVGDASKLYCGTVLSSMTDRSGAAYNATTANQWKFASFGNHILATNFNDPIQIRVNNAGNFANNNQTTAPNANEPVSADPKANFIAVYQNHLMIANCSFATAYGPLSVGTHPSLVMFSQTDNVRRFGDETRNPSLRGSGWQYVLDEYGPITAIFGGTIAYVFKSRAIYLVSGYPPAFTLISDRIGCMAPKSIVKKGEIIYFMSNLGPARIVGDRVEIIAKEQNELLLGVTANYIFGSTTLIGPRPQLHFVETNTRWWSTVFSFRDNHVYFICDGIDSDFNESSNQHGGNITLAYDELSDRLSLFDAGYTSIIAAPTNIGFSALSIVVAITDQRTIASSGGSIFWTIFRTAGQTRFATYVDAGTGGLHAQGCKYRYYTKFFYEGSQEQPKKTKIVRFRFLQDYMWFNGPDDIEPLTPTSARVDTIKDFGFDRTKKYHAAEAIVQSDDGWFYFPNAVHGYAHRIGATFDQTGAVDLTNSTYPLISFYAIEVEYELGVG